MSSYRSLVLPIVASVATLVVLVGFFVAGFVVRGWWDEQRAPAVADAPAPGERVVEGVSPDDDPYWGPADAAVVVVEFADYQCPFCRQHSQQTLDRLREEFQDRVRYVFRDFPIESLHPQAFVAAEASQCAHAQGRFWAYHDRLFDHPDELGAQGLVAHAEALGLDVNDFEACLSEGTYRDEVQADLDAGLEYGVAGTPAFFINGRAVEGAASFDVFREIIEEELAGAG